MKAAKAKLPGRKITRKEALAIAESIMVEQEGRRKETDEAEARRERTVLEYVQDSVPGYFPEQINPGLASMIARIREMAEDYKMLMDFTLNVKGGPHYDEWRPMMKKWEELIDSRQLEPFLSAAPYLLKIMEGE